jgi:MoaA/NifB/PqqE/SkfB family radical SAM enzyme
MLKYCSSPWDTIYIDRYGQISSCLCSGWHKKGPNMGNLNFQTFTEAVNTIKFQEMRGSIVDQSYKYCRQDQCHRLYQLDEVEHIPTTHLSLPTNINLGIDYNCNLKCEMCRTKNIYSKDVNPSADRVLNKLVDAYQTFDTTTFVYCDATGDVFASSAYRKFFIREDLPKCFKFCIQTNGNLITKNLDLLDKIQDQLDIFIVSFDAATADTYKVTRGGSFEQVVAGVKSLVERGISVTTQYVLQHKNYKEVLDYYKLCKDLKVSHIGVQKLDRWNHMTSEWWAENQLDQNPQVDEKQLLNDLLEMQKDPNVGFCGGIHEFIAKRTL